MVACISEAERTIGDSRVDKLGEGGGEASYIGRGCARADPPDMFLIKLLGAD